MTIVNPRIEAYLRTLQEDDDPVRRAMERRADETGFPIVGPLVGRLLELLARAIGARRVVELGSGFGYSALFLARAVGPDGLVICTDRSDGHRRLAESYLSQAGLWGRVRFYVGDALDILRRIGGTWDLIFNDVDKEAYPETIDLAYAHLRPGGLFISDNALWYGRVVPGAGDGSTATEAVRAFNRRLFDHPGFFTTIVPIRDGVAVALRV